MSRAGVDVIFVQDTLSSPTLITGDTSDQSPARQADRFMSTPGVTQGQSGPRRTPRKSLIVVLPENHVVSPELIADRLPPEGGTEEMDVILAYAGQSINIAALLREVRDLQVLRAPSGTSTEDLRELAMRQAPGDIVTLLCGTPVLE
jgi:hypothetical protein